LEAERRSPTASLSGPERLRGGMLLFEGYEIGSFVPRQLK